VTRKEIEKLAKQIVNDVEGVNSYERSYGYVTEDLVALVRATLQEAARAVCPDCRNEVALEAFKKNEKTYWGHQSEKGDTARCDATPIHGLIAELDKEADRE